MRTFPSGEFPLTLPLSFHIVFVLRPPLDLLAAVLSLSQPVLSTRSKQKPSFVYVAAYIDYTLHIIYRRYSLKSAHASLPTCIHNQMLHYVVLDHFNSPFKVFILKDCLCSIGRPCVVSGIECLDCRVV